MLVEFYVIIVTIIVIDTYMQLVLYSAGQMNCSRLHA